MNILKLINMHMGILLANDLHIVAIRCGGEILSQIDIAHKELMPDATAPLLNFNGAWIVLEEHPQLADSLALQYINDARKTNLYTIDLLNPIPAQTIVDTSGRLQ